MAGLDPVIHAPPSAPVQRASPSASARQLRYTKRLGHALALLALVCQVLLGGAALLDNAAAGQPTALGVICHADAPLAPGKAPSPHRHAPGCALCPLCVMAMQGVLPALAPALPRPSVRMADRAVLPPPARAPPAQPRRIALPRGPPVLT